MSAEGSEAPERDGSGGGDRAVYELALAEHPVRCGRCNGPLEALGGDGSTPEYVPDAAIEDRWRCSECGQCFRTRGHWEAVERTLAGL